jgi:hypothetical protein
MAGTAVRGRLTWQVATVTSVICETASVVTIGLDVPGWPGRLAGQHLDVRLTAEDGYHAERQYSIAPAPVRAENLVGRCDQQSCPSGRPAMMITGHVPAVRLPPDHATDLMAAAISA